MIKQINDKYTTYMLMQIAKIVFDDNGISDLKIVCRPENKINFLINKNYRGIHQIICY